MAIGVSCTELQAKRQGEARGTGPQGKMCSKVGMTKKGALRLSCSVMGDVATNEELEVLVRPWEHPREAGVLLRVTIIICV